MANVNPVMLNMIKRIIFFLIIVVGAFNMVRAQEQKVKPVIIDTDMAADDWMAILYLLQRTDVDVKAITVTGAGEAHCSPGIRNGMNLVALAGKPNIPVVCGRETPLKDTQEFPQSWRDGVDALYNISIPENPNPVNDTHAVEFLTTMLKNSPEKMTLLVLGPFTNIAEALQADLSLIDKIEMIYVMGGAFNVDGNVIIDGELLPAEWNIFVDPYAANVAVHSGVPITFVPLDATNRVPLTLPFYEQIEKDHTTPAADFVYKTLKHSRHFIEAGDYYFWDPLAAVILTDESLATIEEHRVAVIEAEGHNSGQTVIDKMGSPVRIVTDAHGSTFESIFVDVLNGRMPIDQHASQ